MCHWQYVEQLHSGAALASGCLKDELAACKILARAAAFAACSQHNTITAAWLLYKLSSTCSDRAAAK